MQFSEDIKHVNIKKDFKECYENPQELIMFLKETFKIFENGKVYKIDATTEALQLIEKYLYHFVQLSSSHKEEFAEVVTELYRSLRNCTTNKHVQDFIVENTNILQTTQHYIKTSNPLHLCLKIILQFLINLISSNLVASKKVYSEFLDFVKNLMEHKMYTYECSALIYNMSLFNPIDMNLFEMMLNLEECETQNEFICFFLEKCISDDCFWSFYKGLRHKHKLTILNIIRTYQIQNKDFNIPDSGLEILIDCFLRSPDIFFKITNVYKQDEVQEVSLLLGVLSSISSKDKYIDKLQQNKNILVTASALLINFHRLGKSGNNSFTPVQKLSGSQSDEAANPVFGLKADLIQLIGNMCWKNNIMKNLAREAEVIPVILDCCNIDANNPFIIQWCIFAIRNLCENNPENQKMIGGLQKKGTVSSSVLEEFGLTLQGDNDTQLKIVPLDSLQS
ncbi:ataxin-10 [Diorhabda carinulata]|uniref:ataxin-10 n=1 Tax=Diorhabda carinulata TaxID=1163345 RepID=UPI0025A02162|nr:ataxin-10 [Diorhabda carinulata]